MDTNEVSAERDALVSEQSSLEHQLAGRTTELTASSSGYFSEVVDRYESILTPSSLDEMTVEQFDKTVAQQPSAENSNSLGKIVKGFNWYLRSYDSGRAGRASAGRSGADSKLYAGFDGIQSNRAFHQPSR